MKPDKVPNPSGVGTIEDYWGPSKKILNDIKFLESLQNYDKDNIPPPVMKKLMTTVMLDEGFVPEKIRAVSVAAEGTLFHPTEDLFCRVFSNLVFISSGT